MNLTLFWRKYDLFIDGQYSDNGLSVELSDIMYALQHTHRPQERAGKPLIGYFALAPGKINAQPISYGDVFLKKDLGSDFTQFCHEGLKVIPLKSFFANINHYRILLPLFVLQHAEVAISHIKDGLDKYDSWLEGCEQVKVC